MRFRDRRRKHRHWKVTVTFDGGGKFARVYIDKEQAKRHAERQKKSAVVQTVCVTEVNRKGRGRGKNEYGQ